MNLLARKTAVVIGATHGMELTAVNTHQLRACRPDE